MNLQISDLEAEAIEIKDSRGRPTVQVTLRMGNAEGVGDVPAGASKGEDEARTVPVPQALENIKNTIVPLMRRSAFNLKRHEDVVALERQLIDQSGDNYGVLGANAVLPVSRALWQLAARLNKQTLSAYMRSNLEGLSKKSRVHFLMNIFNGGLHALRDGETLGQDRIDIQEIMVVPTAAPTYRDALVMGERIDAALKEVLQRNFDDSAITRADEAGFSVKGLGDSSRAIGYVFEAMERAGYAPGSDVKLALDVAASSFYDKDAGVYRFRGESLDSDGMVAYLVQLVDRYEGKILSIEDGLDENDWEGWTKLSAEMSKRSVVTVGDDLFVTQLPRLQRGIEAKAAHAILVKVNQNGSVLGTLDVMRHARKNGMRCIISHRSGETLDDSISDLAFATGAFGLKTGDPQPVEDFPEPSTWVRRRKYLRMIDLEESR